MEERIKINEKYEKGSNSCVIDLSIDADVEDKDKDKENTEGNIMLNKSFDEIKNFSQKLTLKDNFENIFEDIFLDDEEKSKEKIRNKKIKIINKNIKSDNLMEIKVK